MKRKLVSLILTAVMAAGMLAGCGDSSAPADTDAKKEADTETVETEAAESEDTEKKDEFEDTTVTLFAAKSLNGVLEELIAEYNKTQPNVKIVGSYDSSGTLMTQIEEGAVCDIFFSAAQKQMDQLQQEDNLIEDGTRYNVVNNQVCVVTYNGSNTKVTGLSDIGNADRKQESIQLAVLSRLESIQDRPW